MRYFLVLFMVLLCLGCAEKEKPIKQVFVKSRETTTHWGGRQSHTNWHWCKYDILEVNGSLWRVEDTLGDKYWVDSKEIVWKEIKESEVKK